MAYTRNHVLAKWSSETEKKAFVAQMEPEYRAPHRFPAQYGRNLSGTLLKASGTTKQELLAQFLLYISPSPSTVQYGTATYDIATPTDLLAMYSATDLQIQGLDDDDFWEAATMGDFDPTLLVGAGTVKEAQVRIVEK
jgi:hypothetical protein